MKDNEVDKDNPSVVVAGYIKVAPRDRDAFVKVLHAHVPRKRRTDASRSYGAGLDRR